MCVYICGGCRASIDVARKSSGGGSNGIAWTSVARTAISRTSISRNFVARCTSQALITAHNDGGVEGLFPNPFRICQFAEFARAGFARGGYGEGCWGVGPGWRGEGRLFFLDNQSMNGLSIVLYIIDSSYD